MSAPRILLVLLVIVALPVDTAAQRHAAFGARSLQARDHRGVLHLFLDSQGDLYPGRGVTVNDDGVRRWRTLEAYFEANAEPRRTLAARTGVAATLPAKRLWALAQDTLRARTIRQINTIAKTDRRTVVFLVHGFRVDDAEADYEALRQQVTRAYPGTPFLFVYVNWDGMSREHLNLLGTWSRANVNAPLVGLELRRIIEGLDDGLPLRVITHSLGGGVIASALWPRTDVTHTRGRYVHWSTRTRGGVPYLFPPNPDFRLGMLVPAIPGDAVSPMPRSTSRSLTGSRLVVVGQNEWDWVVKVASLGGATNLAVDAKVFCNRMQRAYERDPTTTALRVDFSRPTGMGSLSHHMQDYFKRQGMRQFLELMFGSAVPREESSSECKPAQPK